MKKKLVLLVFSLILLVSSICESRIVTYVRYTTNRQRYWYTRQPRTVSMYQLRYSEQVIRNSYEKRVGTNKSIKWKNGKAYVGD